MDPIIITIGTSIIAAIITSVLTQREMKRRSELDLQNQYATRYNEKKWSTYIQFITTVRQLISNREFNELIESDIFVLAADIILIGSDDVVRSFRAWRGVYRVNGPLDHSSLELLFSLIIYMRKDLGNQKTDLDLDEMLGALVPNYMRSI
jgi:hypothetical protein